MLLFILLILFIFQSIKNPRFRFQWKRHCLRSYFLAGLCCFAGALMVELSGINSYWLEDQLITVLAGMLLGTPLPFLYLLFRFLDKDYKRLKECFENPAMGKNPNLSPEAPAPVLPKQLDQRSRIVREFNRLYELHLEEEEVVRIATASLMNQVWADEILAMKKEYNHISEWLSGDTLWLRIYMKAFTIQDITSDIEVQEAFAMQSLNDVFSYTDSHRYNSISECIRDINHHFFANFDDITFMLAYRLLEEKGFHHQLPRTKLMTSDDCDDRVAEKYL